MNASVVKTFFLAVFFLVMKKRRETKEQIKKQRTRNAKKETDSRIKSTKQKSGREALRALKHRKFCTVGTTLFAGWRVS